MGKYGSTQGDGTLHGDIRQQSKGQHRAHGGYHISLASCSTPAFL